MSKTSLAQGLREGQEGEFPGNGGASLPSFKGGVPEGVDNAGQRKGSPAPPPAGRAEAEALGLVPYKSSITVLRDKARLMRVARSVGLTARVMEEEAHRGGFRSTAVFVTLTYRPGEKWAPRDVTECLEAIREYLRRRRVPLRYCWVGEIQEHRASWQPGETCLHYHVMIWLPLGRRLPMPDKRGWWRHGDSKIEYARSSVGYLAKYASKGGCLDYVPKGARLAGAGGLTREGRSWRSWKLLPGWVREKWGEDHRAIRATGGGWLSRLTGEIIPSAFRMVAHAQDWSWVKFELVEVVT